MASNTSSLAARLAGRRAARMPASAPSADDDGESCGRERERVEPLLLADRPDHGPAGEGAEADAAEGAEHGDDHRLPPHHRADATPRLADRPQQAELTGALVHRERDRVADAHDGDQDRDREQAVDEGQRLVDLPVDRVEVLATCLHVGCVEPSSDLLHGGLRLVDRHAGRRRHQHDDVHRLRGVRVVGSRRDDHVAEQVLQPVDHLDGQRRLRAVGPADLDRRTDRPAVVRGVVRLHGEPVGGQRRDVAVLHLHVGDRRQVRGVDHDRVVGLAVDLDDAVSAGRDLVELGQLAQCRHHRRVEAWRAEVRLGDHEVGGHRAVGGAADRGLHRRREHGERGDHGDADHQRRRSARRAARVAHRVAPGQHAGPTAQGRDRRADHRGRGPGDDGTEQHGTDEGHERAEAHRAHRLAVRARQHQRDTSTGGDESDERPPGGRAAAIDGDVAQCGEWCDPRCLDRRGDAGDQGDTDADGHRRHDRSGVEDQPDRQLEVVGGEQRLHPARQAVAGGEAERRGDRADDQRLDADRSQHLAP